jgi:hypothetical protein
MKNKSLFFDNPETQIKSTPIHQKQLRAKESQIPSPKINSILLVAKGHRLEMHRAVIDSRLPSMPSKPFTVDSCSPPHKGKDQPRNQREGKDLPPESASPSRVLLKFSNAPTDKALKFIVCPGNNHQLIQRLMGKREWWAETSPANTIFNFRWQPHSCRENYSRLDGGRSGTRQIVNHFEFQEVLSNKARMLKNLKSYCEGNGLDPFALCPLTFRITSL